LQHGKLTREAAGAPIEFLQGASGSIAAVKPTALSSRVSPSKRNHSGARWLSVTTAAATAKASIKSMSSVIHLPSRWR
jgi:hypothetical protein